MKLDLTDLPAGTYTPDERVLAQRIRAYCQDLHIRICRDLLADMRRDHPHG